MKVSVLMPVYNAAATVDRALNSLFQQRFHDSMEIVVIDDGSTDGTLERLRSAENIRLLARPHEGIVSALNAGLEAASGTYIARMDADDFSHPNRIAKQTAFLDASPEVGLLGCRVGFGGNREKQTGYATYVDWINTLITPEQLTANRFIESPFAHPSIMFRRELIEQFGGYRDGPFPEDYELWLRWMNHGVQAAKLEEELLEWSDPPSRLSRTDPRYHPDAFYATKAHYLTQWLEQNNPHHPNVVIWGAGRVTRKRAALLREHGLRITHYIDLIPKQLPCNTPVLQLDELPNPGKAFIIPMVANRGAREKIRTHLEACGHRQGIDYIFAA